MEGTSRIRAVIDIGATAQQHSHIAGHLLAAHALTGCDTVAFMWGIGKAKAVKVLLPRCNLLKMGNTDMPMDEVLLEATQLVARCYGWASSESMSATRYEVWIGKPSKRKVTGAPKLKSIPPTSSEAFEQNVRRAHFQVSVWKAALEKDPPELAPTNFGWEKDEASRSLLPVTISGVALAPMDVLNVTSCGCATDQPCATIRCMCGTAQMSGT